MACSLGVYYPYPHDRERNILRHSHAKEANRSTAQRGHRHERTGVDFPRTRRRTGRARLLKQARCEREAYVAMRSARTRARAAGFSTPDCPVYRSRRSRRPERRGVFEQTPDRPSWPGCEREPIRRDTPAYLDLRGATDPDPSRPRGDRQGVKTTRSVSARRAPHLERKKRFGPDMGRIEQQRPCVTITRNRPRHASAVRTYDTARIIVTQRTQSLMRRCDDTAREAHGRSGR